MKHTRSLRRAALLFVLLALVFSLSGCAIITNILYNSMPGSDMPFNGEITFHAIGATVPKDFIRDSTQSKDDAWLFEKNRYTQMIILTRNDMTYDADTEMAYYLAYMHSMDVDAQRTSFRGCPAVHSTYTRDGVFCQEMFFAHAGSLYAVALRGGDEAQFNALLDTVVLHEPA